MHIYTNLFTGSSLSEALRLAPGSAEIRMILGSTLQQLERLDEIEALYREALERQENYDGQPDLQGNIYNNLGNTLRAKGWLTESEASYQRSLELRPNIAAVYVNLGSALLELGKYSAAQASFRKALKIRPNYADAYNNLLFCDTNNAAVTTAELFAEHLRLAEQFEAPLPAALANPHQCARARTPPANRLCFRRLA